MATKVYCDKCGKEIPEEKVCKREIYKGESELNEEIDLCSKDAKEFDAVVYDWLKH